MCELPYDLVRLLPEAAVKLGHKGEEDVASFADVGPVLAVLFLFVFGGSCSSLLGQFGLTVLPLLPPNSYPAPVPSQLWDGFCGANVIILGFPYLCHNPDILFTLCI